MEIRTDTVSVQHTLQIPVRYVYYSPSRNIVHSIEVGMYGIGLTRPAENYAADVEGAVSQHAMGAIVIPIDGLTALRLGMVHIDTLKNDYPELPIEIQAAIRMML